jgi:DNA-binding HxlR family transcriptional regulator
MARSYIQYCPVAHSLELVGERWSLLIVRDLLKGPKRYSDLIAGLPGLGTNILAARLKELEEGEVIRKRKLPPPANCNVYELTEYGAELEEPLYALARWGARSLPPPGRKDEFYPEWGLNAFAALFNEEAARGLTESYVLRVDDDAYTVRLVEGHLDIEAGASEGVDLDAALDQKTFFGLASRELVPSDALAAGAVKLEAGDPETLERFFRVFNFASRVPTAA